MNQFIRLHLIINGRRILNCPFIVLDLGHQDVIVGIKWMRRFRVHLDPQRNQFLWPSDTPSNTYLAREVKLLYFSSKLQGEHLDQQSDANRRDQALEHQMRRHKESRLGPIPISILRAPSEPALTGFRPLPLAAKPKTLCQIGNQKTKSHCTEETPIINICQISANALHFNMKRPKVEFFQTSLYELDRLIDESENDDEDEEIDELIKLRLPRQH